MKKLLISLLLVQFAYVSDSQSPDFELLKTGRGIIPAISVNGKLVLSPPEEGLWSVATGWSNRWPDKWIHASADSMTVAGDWKILSGTIKLLSGTWKVRDSYKQEGGLVKCIRRWEWTGTGILDSVTLSVRWKVKGANLQAFLPGILYYGNPSGYKNTPDCVVHYTGRPGEMAIFEDHRYPMPFACLESSGKERFGAVIHTVPISLRDPKLSDHWWSMGVAAFNENSELILLSGPITYNGKKSIAKALQCDSLLYDNTFLKITPGTVIEKTFYLDAFSIDRQGTAFQKPVHDAIELYRPFYTEDLPGYQEILESKYRFAKSRWMEAPQYAGFNMYGWTEKPKIVMGWCGQADSPGYALQMLKNTLNNDPFIDTLVQRSMDFLSTCPVTGKGFPVVYNPEDNSWSNPDPVSMGQAMYNIAKAIEAARKNMKYDTRTWVTFLKKACDAAADRILDHNWNPRSTAEGFYIAPLVISSGLLGSDLYRKAAIKAADYYAARHLNMVEPYWGGTLDASGEDKEGAWAAFQGFIYVYEMTKDTKYLVYASHACDVCLSYTVVWDIPLPPGRMSDHMFRTRGWTVVSPQNQHIDVFGVFFTPEIYKIGLYTGNENLRRLAKVMFLSCGQIIDPYGSQGEQMNHTNYTQSGQKTDPGSLRGGYSENWTVFWITAHFLNAAARFEEMGIEL
jgi:hypothetical protein